VSPWWREQVRIALAPDRLVAVRLARGPRRRVLVREERTVAADKGDTAAILATLAQLLGEPKWQGADAVVLLSSRFAVHQLLPWTDAMLDRDEEGARARRLYARSHADAAATLDLRRSAGAFGSASVVAGVEQQLLEGIRAAFAGSKLRLQSIQPYLMAAFNQSRHALPRGAHWFVVVERGTISSALLDGGRWVSLRSRRVSGLGAPELGAALRRQALAHAASEGVTSVVVHAPEHGDSEWTDEGWSFRRLQLPCPLEAC
jgi:hypothetical protein